MYDWLFANRLSLNAGKTEFIVFRPSRKQLDLCITFKLHHTKLYESTKIKYLGLILDNKLNWKAHIAELSKKLSRAVGMLYKIKTFVTPSVLRSLYYSLFNSHLACGLVVWGSANKTDLIKLKISKREQFMLFQIGLKDTSINHPLSNLKILNIDDLFKLQLSSLMRDYDHILYLVSEGPF